MPEDLLATLQALDPAVLTEVVRADQRSAHFEITTWSVRRLSEKGIMNPDGLWLFSGQGVDKRGARAWSVVLKILNRRDEKVAPDVPNNWQRELLVAQSGLTEHLPGCLKAPRFYKADETPTGGWLWMEHVVAGRSAPWQLEDYGFAARQLGRWNGASAISAPPAEPWWARRLHRRFFGWINPETDWQFPLNQQHVSAADRARHDQLWDERELFCRVVEELPQVVSHFDSQRRNLFLRAGEAQAEELVLVDWASYGLGPLGAELSNLVGFSGILLEWPAAEVRELDRVAFGKYVQGLQDAGWSGSVDEVRLGYTAWVAVQIGCTMPAGLAGWCSSSAREAALRSFDLAEEALFWLQLPMLAYALDCADEARHLMAR